MSEHFYSKTILDIFKDVPKLYDFGLLPYGLSFIAMEKLKNSVYDAIRSKHVSIEQAIELGRQTVKNKITFS